MGYGYIPENRRAKDIRIDNYDKKFPDDVLNVESALDHLKQQTNNIANEIDNITTVGGGLSYTAKKAIIDLFGAVAYYNEDISSTYQILKDALLVAVDSITLDKTELTFTSATSQTLIATKSPIESEGILVWTSSNTSVATVDDNGVVTATGNGECTITVTCGSVYATCNVSVSGILATYSITNNLTNVTTSNNIDNIAEGTGYIATLTANSNYIISSVTVTMGEEDITSTAYSNGAISISSVTGNVVITATAIEDVGWISGTAYDITWTDGYKVNQSTGENTEDTGRSVSDFLPCSGVSGLIGNSNINGGYLYAYDSEYKYLGRIIFNSSYPCAVNRNVAYVRIHCITTNKDAVTLSPISYDVLSENTTWDSGQFYTISYIEKASINTGTGVQTTSTDWWASDYVYCYGASILNMLNYIESSSWRKIVVFYDSNKDYISGTIGSDSPYTIPENAVYFRVAGFDGFEYTIQKSNKPIISLV